MKKLLYLTFFIIIMLLTILVACGYPEIPLSEFSEEISYEDNTPETEIAVELEEVDDILIPEAEDIDILEEPDDNSIISGDVFVSTPQELFDAIAPDTYIVLKAGYYDLSTVTETANRYVTSMNELAALMIYGVNNLTLIAEPGARVELVTPDLFSEVLMFSHCNDIKLSGIYAGHSVTDEYQCDAGVVYFIDSTNIEIENCWFYGSGSVGINLINCYNVMISDTTITDCSLRAVYIHSSHYVIFRNCDFINNRAYSNVIMGFNSSAEFINCNITGNNNLLWGLIYFEGTALFDGCIIKDNRLASGREPVFSGFDISIRNCEIEKKGFSEYWSGNIIDLGGNVLT